jgi:hypothetical protein
VKNREVAQSITSTVAVPNPRMRVAYFTARQHAIGTAYVHRMHHTTEEMLDRLETEREDEVYHRVCQRLGFNPLDGDDRG